jgi:hypothetical protein
VHQLPPHYLGILASGADFTACFSADLNIESLVVETLEDVEDEFQVSIEKWLGDDEKGLGDEERRREKKKGVAMKKKNKTGGDVEVVSSFLLAKRCMRIIDFDRLIRVCEECNEEGKGEDEGCRYSVRLASLRPLESSPKNNVIIGRVS